MYNFMCCFLLSDTVHIFTRSYMSVHGKTVTLHAITRYFSCNYVSTKVLHVILRKRYFAREPLHDCWKKKKSVFDTQLKE